VLEEELRRSAGEFKKAQVELVGLVEQFVETRKTLFADEQNASDQYVSNLKRVVSLFDKTFSEYPHLISSALDSSTKAVENLQARLEAMAVAVASLDSSQLQQVEAELQKLKEQMVGLSDGVGSLTQSVGNLTSRSNDFPIAMGQMFNSASTIAAEGLSELHTQLRVLIKEVGDVDRLISDFVRLQTLKVVGR
jgi:DNA repair exonuclease SbcCD ATPase subunit